MKVYNIHDNGDCPFCVEYSEDQIDIYRQERMPCDLIGYTEDMVDTEVNMDDTEVNMYVMLGKKVLGITHPLSVWIGDNDRNVDRQDHHYIAHGVSPGNSILVRVSDKEYIFIGQEIYRFVTEDTLREFYSPIGPCDVPYPYAIGDTLVFFLTERVWMAKEELDLSEDLYAQMYDKRRRGHDQDVMPMTVQRIAGRV